jgi:hypothetical protein
LKSASTPTPLKAPYACATWDISLAKKELTVAEDLPDDGIAH